MRIGIDASNLRQGGGITHLVEVLREGRPQSQGVEEVVVWGNREILARIAPKPWLRVVHETMLDQSLPVRTYWQLIRLPQLALRDCDVLFAPGGRVSDAYRPIVTMSRNLLPFEPAERRRYGLSWMHLKLLLLRDRQTASFRSADGVIFLNRYSHAVVMRQARKLSGNWTIIPHGISSQFMCEPRPQKPIGSYSKQSPLRLLYVSIVDLYKHQWHVAEAVSALRREGMPIQLDLVGPAYPPALKRLRETTERLDPTGEFIHYRGPVPYSELPAIYAQADMAVFASSCENMPNILLESMAAGLPIACSSREPMPAVLGDAGAYFDPEQPAEIATALRFLLVDAELRQKVAQLAFQRAHAHSWRKCAEDTFAFIAEIGRSYLTELEGRP